MEYIISNKQFQRTLTALCALALAGCGGGGIEAVEPINAAAQAQMAEQSQGAASAQNNWATHSSNGYAAQPANIGSAASVDEEEGVDAADYSIVEHGAALPAPPVDIEQASDASAVAFVKAAKPLPLEKSVAVGGASSVIQESFDGITMTGFGTALLKQKNIHLVNGKGVNGSKAIEVDYRGNSKGSERVIVNYKLPPALQYTLSFDVNFCSGFDFRKGGKLHGLGPANPVTGGNKVSPPRWSARAMFRPQGGLQSYIYSQNMAGQYGDVVIAKNFHFQPNRYYAITYQVVLNNPASSSNGYMRVFVDGTPVVHHTNIKFRSTESPESLISTLMFNTFHGGHTADWAPRNADGSYAVACAYFDNFAVTPSLHVKPAPGM